LPAWQSRLAELEDAIAKGQRPDGAALSSSQFAPKPQAGAYQYLVGSGSVLLFAGLAAFVGIMWRYLGTWGQGALLAAVTVALVVLVNRLSARIQSTANALSALTVGSWFIDAGWMLHHVYTNWNRTDRIIATWMIPTLLSILTAVLFLALGKRFANAIWGVVGQVFIPVSAGMILTTVELNISQSTPLTSVYLAALALPLTVLILMLVENNVAMRRAFTDFSRTIALVITSLFTAGFVGHSIQLDYQAPLAWSLHLVLLAAFAFTQPRIRALSVPLLAGAVALSAGFADLPIGARVAFPVLLCLLSLRLGKEAKFPAALLISATSAAWLAVAFTLSSEAELPLYAAGLSAVTGLVVMVHAWLGKREDYVLFGAAFLALAISLIYAYLEVTNLESLTLPIAAAFLMSGVLAFRIKPSLSSLVWLGPSFAVVLLPSALRATESLTYSTRFSATLVAAIALLILGARLGYAGMVIVGFVTVLILVQHPLASLFQAVHPWISFTLSGLLLLVIGARFEYLRTRAGVAKAWLTDSLR